MTDASLTVSLSANIPEVRLAQITREFARDLSRAGLQARPVDAPPVTGQRGDGVTLGVLALALVTTGTVKAVIECLKAYLSRERALIIKFEDDSKVLEVTARNVDTSAVRAALESMTLPRPD